jgi:hypothetical protein
MSGVTVDYLFKKSNRQAIKVIVDDFIKSIDGKILMAHEQGFSKIGFDLPVNFAVNNMDVKDAQIMIYSELLDRYKNPSNKKNFEKVYLEFLPNKTIMHIEWVNGMDENERSRRVKLIQDHIWKGKKTD